MAVNEKTSTEIMKEKFEGKELNAEQLENVAGGVRAELSEDSQFLNVLLQGRSGQCKRYTEDDFGASGFGGLFLKRDILKEIGKAWEAAGVRCEFSYHGENSYFSMKDGKKMTRLEAMNYAQDFVGKHMSSAEWCY